jgi:hypothetical protein
MLLQSNCHSDKLRAQNVSQTAMLAYKQAMEMQHLLID